MKRKMISLTLLFALTFSLSNSNPRPGSDKSNRKALTPPQLTPVNCKLTLAFATYPGRTCTLPNVGADPTIKDGADKLTSLTTTYFCKITVEPNAPSQNYDASVYTTVWKSKASFLNIKVPKETSSKLTIDFYEDCNFCSNNASNPSRPYFRYSAVLQKGQPFKEAYLQYLLNAACR
ncbi:hypothetical protein HGH93_05350 [Chitinophaga polysaccharea]|uniref:hypothetical protein n=1 Tax=Chitinophaga TaxID=79328 RepID=UPI0014555521|nr:MULTISPECIES: hypothetical protein [Chitinophaga]NLR57512.1 hypothetical protein [Chitinophaga polysaccharea]NLU95426.1 hypothetical protein [Chitinophaga sp. Ak27]